MNYKRTLVLGLIIIMIGTAFMDIPIITHMRRELALPKQLFGLALVLFGGYIVYQGKKQQKNEKENQDS